MFYYYAAFLNPGWIRIVSVSREWNMYVTFITTNKKWYQSEMISGAGLRGEAALDGFPFEA